MAKKDLIEYSELSTRYEVYWYNECKNPPFKKDTWYLSGSYLSFKQAEKSAEVTSNPTKIVEVRESRTALLTSFKSDRRIKI